MPKPTLRTAIAVSALTAATLVALPPLAASAAGSTLVVDAAVPFRPVTHAASGGLYALAEGNRPADSLLLPIKMHTLTQPPPRVGQAPNGQPPGGDALLVAPQADRVGAAQVIRMPDIYRDFPYRWVSWDDWLAKVDQMVNDRLAATTVSNITAYEIWNEADWTWNTAAAGDFNAGWTRTVQRIRTRDTVTPVAGPGDSHWNPTRMRAFLTNARNTNTLPDIVVWHELGHTSPHIAANVAAYRAMEAELGISPRRIFINEYAERDEIDVPGRVTNYIAKLERAGVWAADRAFWYEYGTVNGLTHNNQPTASWWLYKWYGDMAGNMVRTTPRAQTGLDGFASYDSTRRRVDVVFGDESGTNNVRVTGLGGFGSTVRVRLESTPGSGRFTNVAAPTTLANTTYTVTNGAITVPVPNMSATASYHLVVEPTSGVPAYQQRYEAENASVFRAERLSAGNASNGGHVGRIDNTGDPRNDSYVDFIVNVPTARSYTMTIGYANGTGATATQGLAYNGGPWSTVSYPATTGWAQFSTVNTTVTLNAGYNTIRLAKGSPHFAGGTGYAELDYIQLI
ncbi:carbohydrate-binding protein [Saccharothrix xinjiangensis]|uniref:Carbohydrate-binding protein n=1 Tax=Saccharothrix xinjiangensis TaxID=204798 RepID=A0ABV9Y4J2_9PSEU